MTSVPRYGLNDSALAPLKWPGTSFSAIDRLGEHHLDAVWIDDAEFTLTVEGGVEVEGKTHLCRSSLRLQASLERVGVAAVSDVYRGHQYGPCESIG